MDIRIGHGYDVHRLTEGRALIIGGVNIPNDRGLDGHSDADVLIHALMDAMLGALAMGDIGKMFPDNDPDYEGACSIKLLETVNSVIAERGYAVSNCDMTVVAQWPRLSPYIDEMCRNIAGILGVESDRVSVKATTEEKLGFTGHKEGIAAHAVVLLKQI